MASSPITSWHIDGEKVEIVADFIFLGSKITADGDYSHEIKRRLLLESTQTHVHGVSVAIQPSQPLSSPSPPALNLSQHLGLFQ